MPKLVIWFGIGVLLIIIGLYGNLGSMLGSLITPEAMVDHG